MTSCRCCLPVFSQPVIILTERASTASDSMMKHHWNWDMEKLMQPYVRNHLAVILTIRKAAIAAQPGVRRAGNHIIIEMLE